MARRKRLTRGQRNIAWIEAHCRIPKGPKVGQAAKLTRTQKRILRGIYDTPTRTAIISFGRKNSKTTLAGWLVLLHTVGPEARPNSGVYSAARSKDQAAILYDLAKKSVEASPTLAPYVGIRETVKEFYNTDLGTEYKALSADASTKLGLSPSLVVHDELGQVKGPRDDLFDALETAAGAEEEPLTVIISTQARDDAALLSLLIDDALEGKDPETKLFLYTAPDPDEEHDDPPEVRAKKRAALFTLATAAKANPELNTFMNREEVQRQAARAKRMPAFENSYRNLVLNQRVDATPAFVSKSVWRRNGRLPRHGAFETGVVHAGLDLSARQDLTAFVAVSEPDPKDKSISVSSMFWTPLDTLEERSKRDRVAYDLWVREGYIAATPGASVRLEYVALYLAEFAGRCESLVVHYDRWRIEQLQRELELLEDGIPSNLELVPHGQGFKDMSPAIERLEERLSNAELRHGQNPVLAMCAANTVADSDPAGNQKFNKKRATGRIDGMQALAMSMGETGESESGSSPWDDPEFSMHAEAS